MRCTPQPIQTTNKPAPVHILQSSFQAIINWPKCRIIQKQDYKFPWPPHLHILTHEFSILTPEINEAGLLISVNQGSNDPCWENRREQKQNLRTCPKPIPKKHNLDCQTKNNNKQTDYNNSGLLMEFHQVSKTVIKQHKSVLILHLYVKDVNTEGLD